MIFHSMGFGKKKNSGDLPGGIPWYNSCFKICVNKLQKDKEGGERIRAARKVVTVSIHGGLDDSGEIIRNVQKSFESAWIKRGPYEDESHLLSIPPPVLLPSQVLRRIHKASWWKKPAYQLLRFSSVQPHSLSSTITTTLYQSWNQQLNFLLQIIPLSHHCEQSE